MLETKITDHSTPKQQKNHTKPRKNYNQNGGAPQVTETCDGTETNELFLTPTAPGTMSKKVANLPSINSKSKTGTVTKISMQNQLWGKKSLGLEELNSERGEHI